MVHENGKHGRPSPRTQGVTEEGETFQKYGTQQLVRDPTTTTGVRQVDTGKTFKQFTTAPFQAAKGLFGLQTGTVFSQRILSGQTGATPVGAYYIPEPASPNGNGNGECDWGCWITGRGCDCGCKDMKPCTTCDSAVCKECNAWDLQCEDCRQKDGTCTPPVSEECDLGCLMTFRGCDCGCKDMKPCTTCDSAVCKECNAWDLQCEDCRQKDGTCTPPVSEECGCMPYDFGCEIGCWWNKNKNYVYLLGGLIGLGVLLWLLRPLFGMIGAFKGGSP